jgi:hypothetical protein
LTQRGRPKKRQEHKTHPLTVARVAVRSARQPLAHATYLARHPFSHAAHRTTSAAARLPTHTPRRAMPNRSRRNGPRQRARRCCTGRAPGGAARGARHAAPPRAAPPSWRGAFFVTRTSATHPTGGKTPKTGKKAKFPSTMACSSSSAHLRHRADAHTPGRIACGAQRRRQRAHRETPATRRDRFGDFHVGLFQKHAPTTARNTRAR